MNKDEQARQHYSLQIIIDILQTRGEGLSPLHVALWSSEHPDGRITEKDVRETVSMFPNFFVMKCDVIYLTTTNKVTKMIH